ncbi:unnamed protein product [Rangifer tarandus platyrhynchus]|uniref:Uncharacterized protein n=1 Tax=Rangifer tarandus platyrhynchus TaxID=3082113 RepID=A0ABN8ZAH8_RANTA|nr:unnamed protein product [Rangifer tarandus platyrhynchus]
MKFSNRQNESMGANRRVSPLAFRKCAGRRRPRAPDVTERASPRRLETASVPSSKGDAEMYELPVVAGSCRGCRLRHLRRARSSFRVQSAFLLRLFS